MLGFEVVFLGEGRVFLRWGLGLFLVFAGCGEERRIVSRVRWTGFLEMGMGVEVVRWEGGS